MAKRAKNPSSDAMVLDRPVQCTDWEIISEVPKKIDDFHRTLYESIKISSIEEINSFCEVVGSRKDVRDTIKEVELAADDDFFFGTPPDWCDEEDDKPDSPWRVLERELKEKLTVALVSLVNLKHLAGSSASSDRFLTQDHRLKPLTRRLQSLTLREIHVFDCTDALVYHKVPLLYLEMYYHYARHTRPIVPALYRCPVQHLICKGPLFHPGTLAFFTEVNATTLELVGHSPDLDLVDALARLNDSIKSLSLIYHLDESAHDSDEGEDIVQAGPALDGSILRLKELEYLKLGRGWITDKFYSQLFTTAKSLNFLSFDDNFDIQLRSLIVAVESSKELKLQHIRFDGEVSTEYYTVEDMQRLVNLGKERHMLVDGPVIEALVEQGKITQA
jgi:hypothetical protein